MNLPIEACGNNLSLGKFDLRTWLRSHAGNIF